MWSLQPLPQVRVPSGPRNPKEAELGALYPLTPLPTRTERLGWEEGEDTPAPSPQASRRHMLFRLPFLGLGLLLLQAARWTPSLT